LKHPHDACIALEPRILVEQQLIFRIKGLLPAITGFVALRISTPLLSSEHNNE